MKRNIIISILLILCWVVGMSGSTAWAGGEFEWTWEKGPDLINQQGVYGDQGTPAEANTPGARRYAVSWIEADDVLWLFGGSGLGGVTQDQGHLNDLWRYDPDTGHWAWIKGSNNLYQQGVYGVQGTPAEANTPGARDMAVSWIDDDGALWLFGGEGRDSNNENGRLNDLWKYDPVIGNWTWIKGSDVHSQQGVYGEMGVEDTANTPGASRGGGVLAGQRRQPLAFWRNWA